MPTLKAKKGDETIEFEFDELVEPPEGFLPANEVENNYVKKDYFESEVRRRTNTAEENAKKALKSDDDFLMQTAKSKWGIDFEDGKPKTGNDVDVDQIRDSVKESIYKDEVEPLRNKVETLKESQLSSEVLREASKRGIRKDKLEPVYQGKSLLELKAIDDLNFADDVDYWAVKKKDEDGFEYSSNPEGKRPYKGVSEWIQGLPDEWYTDNTQNGSGYKGNGVNGQKTKARNMMSSREKAQFIAKHGADKFKELPLKAEGV